MKRIIKNPAFWIFLASVLPVLSLLHPGMPDVHDGQDHVARIANFYASLSEGIIVPRWAANLNWGYGHPILMFLYPLPEYMASIVHFLGFSFVDSTKLVFGLTYVASSLAMYIWMNAEFGLTAGLIGSLLYTFAPYRFVDLHVRGALGEHVAFIFPPLVLYYLWKLAKQKHGNLQSTISIMGASVSLGCLILSHNALALIFLPVIGVYGVYLVVFETKKKWIFFGSLIASLLWGFGLSAFFWIPALLEGKFTLRDMLAGVNISNWFVPLYQLFYSPWNWGWGEQFTKSLGFPQWIGICIAIFFILKTRDKRIRILLTGLLIALVASLFMVTSWSGPLWRSIKILQNFQFPWRFLSLSVFLSAVLGGVSGSWLLSFYHVSKKWLVLICILIVMSTCWMWYPKGYQMRPVAYYAGIYPGTTDTGESTPIWSTRYMDHTYKTPLEIIDGDARVTENMRKTTVRTYTVMAKHASLLLANIVYFPGWKVYVDGKQADVQFQNPTYRGLMTFGVDVGMHSVSIFFEDTKVRKIATIVSVLSVGLLIALLLTQYTWTHSRHT